MSQPANGLLRLDLHVHTAFSYDGFTTPEQLARTCRRRGISGVAITDHNTLEGALICQRVLTLKVIVGEEVSTKSGHVIGLFLKEPIRAGLSVTETIRRIRDQGGLVYLPHPFDRVRSTHLTSSELEEVAQEVDMVEVFNSRNLLNKANRQALDYAEANKRLQTAGSDAHIPSEVGRSYVEMAVFSNAEEFLAKLEAARVQGRKTPLAVRAYIKVRKRLRGIS
jgi:predicted metal-dependent phosphoesterase TrpH